MDQCFSVKSNNRRLLLAPKETTTTLDDSTKNVSKSIVIATEQENENININNKPSSVVENQNKLDSWLCPDKFKEGGKYKEVSFENTMNELVPNKDLEKEVPEVGVFEENMNESKVLLTRPGWVDIVNK